MTIIGISGWAQAGKDTVGSQLAKDYGFHRYAFADTLKAVALDINPWVRIEWGWFSDDEHSLLARRMWGETLRLSRAVDLFGADGAKLIPDVRRFYQDLGVGMRNHVNDGVWVDAVMGRIDSDPWDVPVFPFELLGDYGVSARNLSQVTYTWRQRDYVITDVRFPDELAAIRARNGEIWRVNRPGTQPPNDHISERSLDGERFDRIVDNDGTLEDLAWKVNELMAVLAR